MPSLLKRFNLNYEDLTPDEKDTLKGWEQALSQGQLTLDDVKGFLEKLIRSTEEELTSIRETTSFWTYLFGWKRDFYLKARLKNYTTLYDFVTSPERARKQIEQAIQRIKK